MLTEVPPIPVTVTLAEDLGMSEPTVTLLVRARTKGIEVKRMLLVKGFAQSPENLLLLKSGCMSIADSQVMSTVGGFDNPAGLQLTLLDV